MAIAACNRRGKTTTDIKGANHTPRMLQFHNEELVTASAQSSSAHATRSIDFASRAALPSLADTDKNVSGSPRTTHRRAASEKLSREVTEMSVDVRKRLKDLRIDDVGAADGER